MNPNTFGTKLLVVMKLINSIMFWGHNRTGSFLGIIWIIYLVRSELKRINVKRNVSMEPDLFMLSFLFTAYVIHQNKTQKYNEKEKS